MTEKSVRDGAGGPLLDLAQIASGCCCAVADEGAVREGSGRLPACRAFAGLGGSGAFTARNRRCGSRFRFGVWSWTDPHPNFTFCDLRIAE